MVENQGLILGEDTTINQAQEFVPNGDEVDQGQHGEPRKIKQQIPMEREAPRVVMVNRNQNVDEIIHQVRQDEVTEDNNLASMVERIMA